VTVGVQIKLYTVEN